MRRYGHRRSGLAIILVLVAAYAIQGTEAFNAVELQRSATANVVADTAAYLKTPADYTCSIPQTGGSCRDTITNQATTPLMFNFTSVEAGNALKCAVTNTPTGEPQSKWINPGELYYLNISVGPELADGQTCTVTITVTGDSNAVFKGTTQYAVTVRWALS